MIIETFTAYKSIESWDDIAYGCLSLYIIWIILWIYTIFHSIRAVKTKKSKNNTISILVPLISWPFYWIFKFSKII